MKKKPIIVILGNTVLIEGVLFSLKSQENLTIFRIENPGSDLEECIRLMLPDLIIFELDDPGTRDCLECLKEMDEFSLIGLNLRKNQVTVLNSSQHNTGGMQDFIQIIQDIVQQDNFQ